MCTSMSVNINYRFKFFNNNVSWKKQDDQAYKNANVPVNVFSGQGSGIFVPFKAQPLKNTYRKSLNFSNNYSSSKGTTIKDAIENPGAAPVSKIDCDECSNNHIIQHNTKTNTQTQDSITKNQRMNKEHPALRKLRHKTIIPVAAACNSKCVNKPYFTRLEERRKYLKQDFKSNLSDNVCCYRDPTGYNCSVSRRSR